MPTLRAASILHLDASFENPVSKIVLMRGHTISVSVTIQQLHMLRMPGCSANSLFLHDATPAI
jgi:hypothetical protein